MEKGKMIFETKPDREYIARAWDLPGSQGDALIEILKGETVVRTFTFPAYKVWNIGAHFSDIVTSEIEKNTDGYAGAASTGLGGFVAMTPVPNQKG